MLKKEKEFYKKLLDREKERICKNLGHSREMLTKGEKGIPTHLADYGTDEFGKGLEINLSDAEQKTLNSIRESLQKLENNTFGICDECGKKIAKTRLKALPYAKLCIACQREKEKSGE
ncbi:TraR/DksA family transcriptional regulator [bacterium]|jgi:RNA polymerase-binding protein DksA|nr:TraR/DksA family transcriptional regulator [bacterium]